MNIGIKITGRIHFLLKDKYGNVKEDVWHDNLVVAVGRYHIADQMAEKDEAQMGYMAVGDGDQGGGANPAVSTDTTLQHEIDRNALDGGLGVQGTGADAHKVTYTCTWPPGDGTGAITEAGIFNATSAGSMLCRSAFPVKNKGTNDSLTMTWVLTFSAAS